MLLHVLVGLWLTPFTLSYLDREEFAIFSLTLDILTWLTLLDLGITAGLRIQASRLSGTPSQDAINQLASTAFYAQNVVVIVVLIVGSVLTFGFSHFFSIRPDLQREAFFVMGLSLLGAALSIWSQIFSALLIANQQMHVDNLIGLLLIGIRTVLTVVLLKLDFGIYSLAMAHLAARLITAILAVIRTYRLIPGLQLKFRFVSWNVFRQIGRVGIWFSLGALAGLVIHSFDAVLTAKMVSVESVTALVITGRFYELAGGLVFLLSENARPMLGQMLGQNKISESLATYRQLFALSTGFATVAALSVWSGNACFVTQWVGSVNYAGTSVDLALAFLMITGLWVMPNRVVLSANLAVRNQCLVRICEGVLKLGLSIWLGRMFGIAGILAGTVIASLCTSMWLLPRLTARMFARPFWRFLWDDAARVLALMLILFPVALFARGLATDISGYLGAIAGATITGTFGLTLIWFMMVDKSIRERLQLRHCYEKAFAAFRLGGHSAR